MRTLARAYPGRARAWLLVILAGAAVLRVAFVLHAARPASVGDPVAYTYLGQELARGRGYHNFVAPLYGPPPYPPTAFYPIGYPAVLAGLFWVIWHTALPDNLPRTVALFHAGLGVATVMVAAEVGRRLFGVRAGLVAGAIVALFPNLVFYTATANLETVFNFGVLAALLVLVWAPWRRGTVGLRRLAAFGALLGLSALVKPTSLMFLPLLFVVWLLAGSGWRRALTQTAVATAAAVLVVTPWVARNAARMGTPVFSTGIGDALCGSRHPGATGHFEAAEEDCLKPYDRLPLKEREVRRNRENTRKAARFVAEHPASEVRLTFWRAFYGLRDDHDALLAIDPDNQFFDARWRHVLATVADGFYFAVVALAMMAVPISATRREPRRLFLLLTVAASVAPVLILTGDPRYHVPALPLLAVLAAVPLAAALGPLGARHNFVMEPGGS